MYSFSLFPNITKPTRVTSHSATLIDNIFCNDICNENVFNGILCTDITDHYPVFHIDYSCVIADKPRVIKKRIFSEINIQNFSATLENHDWSDVLSSDDPQAAYTHFHNIYTGIYNDCFPLRVFKDGYKNRKDWLTVGLKKSIKIKNKMYKRQKRSQNPEHETQYKSYKNKLNRLLNKAERDHYQNLLQNNQNNMKKSWRILKEVINKKKNVSSCSRFYVNNSISTDKNVIADALNSFFCGYWT